MKLDPVFALKVSQVDQATTDEVEGVLASEAVNPKSFLDRMAYLRAHRPELYDRAKVIKVEGYKAPTSDEAERRRRLLDGVVDAEIVRHYEDRQGYRKPQLIDGAASAGPQEARQEATPSPSLKPDAAPKAKPENPSKP